MNDKDELLDMIAEWREEGEYEKIVDAIVHSRTGLFDDDLLGALVDAYIGMGEYAKAISILEEQHERLDGYFKWHYRMGCALLFATDSEEAEEGNVDEGMKKNMLERARIEFARCMNMNPPEDCLEECDMYMERVEDALGIGEDYDEDSGEFDPELYDDEELDVIEEHIKENFGEFPTTLHEIVSPDIHVDVCVIPPSPERNYYTLVTEGMGAHIMDLPEELSAEQYGRAELLICLPPDWRVGENDEEWFWPIGLLKGLARLPINCETWLGVSHSIDNREPFAKNTALCGAVLRAPFDVEEGAEYCELPGGERVNFYEIIPIYREEMQFKLDHGANALMEKLDGVSHIVDIKRENLCSDYIPNKKYDKAVFDSIEPHLASIHEKKLDVKDICSANHLAIFLRWFIENDFMSPLFHQRFDDVVKGVLDGSAVDLREFIITKLNGAISSYLFSSRGARFAEYYYDNYDENGWQTYPADIDAFAERYFRWKNIDTKQFKDETYLFVPFDEKYYQSMKGIIDERYADYRAGENDGGASAAKKTVAAFLDCACTSVFSDSPKAVREVLENDMVRGIYAGYTPVPVIYCNQSGGTDEEIILSGENASVICIARIPGSGAVLPRLVEHLGLEPRGAVLCEDPAKLYEIYKGLYGTVPYVICGETVYTPSDIGYLSFVKRSNERGADITRAMEEFVGCECTVFVPRDTDTEIIQAYHRARVRGKKEGFIPLLIVPDKELLDALTLVTGSQNKSEEYGFDKQAVADFRSAALGQSADGGSMMLRLKVIKYVKENSDIAIGAITDGEPLTRFMSIWDTDAQRTKPVILAEVPVKKPWELFAWVPARYRTADNTELIKAAKYWYERHRAQPAVISADAVEFFLDYPIGDDDSLELATEIYGLCPDITDTYETICKHAGILRYSYVWYLRWREQRSD